MIGSLTLTPSFDADEDEYTATTTNDSDKITATATASTATVEIASEDATIASDGTATWESGDNVVVITVTDDGVSGTYTVTVTKSTGNT